MTPKLLRLAAATLIFAGVAVAVNQANQDPQDPVRIQNPDGPNATLTRATPDADPGSILLTVRVDARGVAVHLGTRKPAVEYIRTKLWDRHPFRWEMKNQDGKTIAEGGFDTSLIDLDPANFGNPPRAISDDRIVVTEAYQNVKVPALPDFHRIDFFRVESDVTQPFGTAHAAEITMR